MCLKQTNARYIQLYIPDFKFQNCALEHVITVRSNFRIQQGSLKFKGEMFSTKYYINVAYFVNIYEYV